MSTAIVSEPESLRPVITQAEFDALPINLQGGKDGIEGVDYSLIKNVPSYSWFPTNCTFGDNTEFGAHCRFYGVFEFGKNCEFGPDAVFKAPVTFGSGCRFGDACEFKMGGQFGDACVFGAGCKLHVASALGNACEFGDHCYFMEIDAGDRCSFGRACRFEWQCSFGDACCFGGSTLFESDCVFGSKCTFKGGISGKAQTWLEALTRGLRRLMDSASRGRREAV